MLRRQNRCDTLCRMAVNSSLRRELLALPIEERRELAEELYDSLVEEIDPAWEAEWSKEIKARIGNAEQNPGDLVDARNMVSELRAEFTSKSR